MSVFNAEVKISFSWHVGIGEDSKEVEVQKDRALREREVVYRTIQQIPPNPREPWDREMDFDDLLTPEIPTEQMPDVEPLEAPAGSQEVAAPVASTSSQNVGGTSMPEPDLELLAELLKNPQLVFALTSGQAGEISSSETIKLLDMIKANGGNSLSSLAALGTKTDNKVEVSLPSPTPSSDPVTVRKFKHILYTTLLCIYGIISVFSAISSSCLCTCLTCKFWRSGMKGRARYVYTEAENFLRLPSLHYPLNLQ